jgi:hypothetical protein
MVVAGALALALNVAPSAMAEAGHGSDAGSEVAPQSGRQAENGPGVPGRTTNHYVRSVTGSGTATARCDSGDVATGGGYDTASGFGVSQNRPIPVPGPFGSVNAWQATLELGQTGPITVYVVCETA